MHYSSYHVLSAAGGPVLELLDNTLLLESVHDIHAQTVSMYTTVLAHSLGTFPGGVF